MLGTAGVVLLIGLVRWYFGKSHRTTVAGDPKEGADTATTTSAGTHSVISAIGAKLNSLLGLTSENDAEEAPDTGTKRARGGGRSPKTASRTGRAARGNMSAARPSRAHSRRARPSLEDERDPTKDMAERPRRRRQAPPRDFDPTDPPPRPRRRHRPQTDPDPRSQPPRDARREPRTRRNPYDRPYEGPYDEPRPRSSRFDSYEPYEPRRRRTAPGGNGANPTHHPISQVRYRGEAPSGQQSEPRDDHRSRSRAPRNFPSESWEYEG
jgi:hypothetical protein